MGIAVENDTNIYITDAKYRSIKIVTTISGTINFLLQLQKIYAAFSVHFKNDTVVRKSLETCKELLNQSTTFIKGTVDKVKETCNISKQTNDPEGTVLKRTQDSVSMLCHSIIRLSQIIGTIDQQFTPNLESCPTTMLENLNAYCRDFGTIFRKSVKRIVHWSACYFTSDSSYYPVPTYNLPLDLVPIFPKPKTVSMQKDDVKLLYEWANTHGKCVRQHTVRLETTSYKCGTIPLNIYVSNSIEGTEVTFNHIDEYDDSESANESEETSSSQLSLVLAGNDDHESPVELSFLTTRNSTRSGRTLPVSSRLFFIYL